MESPRMPFHRDPSYPPSSAHIFHATGTSSWHHTPPNMTTIYEPQARQNITHPALHIRNIHDVLVVLEAVRRGILPLITLRLSGSERDQLGNGNVFVWQECTDEGGLVRWTDGRRWSQSKVCAECLFYEEKIDLTEEEREAKARRRAQRICNPGASIPPPPRNQRSSKIGGLTKQTYSFLVRLPGSSEVYKWHAVAYTLWHERADLPVIEDYPALRDIRVPVGVFARSKGFDGANANIAVRGETLSGALNGVGNAGMRRITDVAPPLHMSCALTSHDQFPIEAATLPSLRPGREDVRALVLPPVSWFKSLSRREYDPAESGYEVTQHPRDPVSQEGRRILNSFRLKL